MQHEQTNLTNLIWYHDATDNQRDGFRPVIELNDMNDLERKITLSEMLGSNVLVQSDLNPERFCWGDDVPRSDEKVTVNEWLHVCWLAEQKLSSQECERYSKIAHWHDTWQERADNLRAVKS